MIATLINTEAQTPNAHTAVYVLSPPFVDPITHCAYGFVLVSAARDERSAFTEIHAFKTRDWGWGDAHLLLLRDEFLTHVDALATCGMEVRHAVSHPHQNPTSTT